MRTTFGPGVSLLDRFGKLVPVDGRGIVVTALEHTGATYTTVNTPMVSRACTALPPPLVEYHRAVSQLRSRDELGGCGETSVHTTRSW